MTMKNIDDLTAEDIAGICDHTFLNRSEAYRKTAKEGESPVQLRSENLQSFLEDTIKGRTPYAICVRPEDVAVTKGYLEEQCKGEIIIASVVGFPDGSLYSTGFKVAETKLAIEQGAKEIDMVLNYGKLKAGDETYVVNDIKAVTDEAHYKGALVKLIFETAELTPDQIKRGCEIAREAEVDFVKTSTGFAAYGAKVSDLTVMRENFSGGIKISGGVNPGNVKELLYAALGDAYVELSPNKIRIGESSLLSKL